MSILKIKNLSLSYLCDGQLQPAVRDVSLTVNSGEIVALVGESGCGKTSLCRAILALHRDHAILSPPSKISLCGHDITSMTESQLAAVRGRDAAMVFQDPMTSLNPVVSIGGQIVETIRLHEKKSRRDWQRAAALLGELGIPQPEIRAKQYPHQFSGGMRQRAAIAVALACNPQLLIADEPTTALDPDTKEQIVDILCREVKEKGRGMLFVTHDLELAEKIADRIVVMKDGCIVDDAAFHKHVEKHYHGRIAEPEAERRTPQCDGQPMVSIKNLSKWVLDDLSMNIYKGEIVGLVGPSGCGKSTLARCMVGIYKPEAGSVEYREGCKVQMIFQDSAAALNPRMTLGESIAEPLIIAGRKAGVEKKVYEMMEAVGLNPDLAKRYPQEVSGGQRQRASIARALITDPDFIIADEPVSSLDISIQSQIIHLLKKLQEERKLTMLLISHDLHMVEHVSDRIVELY